MIKQAIAPHSWAYILQNFAIGRGHEHLFCLRGVDGTPGADGITPLCQQYRLGLAPTRIHLLKLIFHADSAGGQWRPNSSENSPPLGVVTNSRGGAVKRHSWLVVGADPSNFPPNKLKGMHGTQTGISTAVRPSRRWEIKRHFLVISTRTCLSFDGISGNGNRME